MADDLILPRLERLKDPKWQYPKTKYRSALAALLSETDHRCGYSLQPEADLGRKSIEVDHFNPTLRHPFRNRHGNLIASCRHCNGAKGQRWSTKEERDSGLYIINPYEEQDYGRHIIEDRTTGKLVGITPTGKWHIQVLDMNADHFVSKRLARTELKESLTSAAYATGQDPTNQLYTNLVSLFHVLQHTLMTQFIPELPDRAMVWPDQPAEAEM